MISKGDIIQHTSKYQGVLKTRTWEILNVGNIDSDGEVICWARCLDDRKQVSGKADPTIYTGIYVKP